MLRLSQGQLTLLDYCPRRFQHTILESLAVPPSPVLRESQQWGERFHLLMQQREMGLPIDAVLAHDEELYDAVARLEAHAPELFDATGETFRQSEHGRSLQINDYGITVVYDLVREWRDRAEIIDWKTYLKPKNFDYLRQDWQTRLYLYVFVETSALTPEQIAMTYWFVRPLPANEGTASVLQSVHVPYSASQHQQTQQDLYTLTTQLTQWLQQGAPFPQLPIGHEKCSSCPFLVRCQRERTQQLASLSICSLEDISEVAI